MRSALLWRRWHQWCWWLPALALYTVARLPSFIEPHWYVDEAGYATIARELLRGKVLYRDAWNNKPPVQLWTVALAVGPFGASEAALHTLTFLSGLATLSAVAYAGRHLLNPERTMVATLLVALALGTPVFDAELILPESFLIAPAAWAGAVLLVRLERTREAQGRLELWPAGVGLLAALAISYQQTAVADAAAFGLILLVAAGSARRVLVYTATVVAVTGAWLAASIATAGPSRVAYALGGFYIAYTRSVLPHSKGGALVHWLWVLGATAAIVAGAVLARRSRSVSWGLWVWAGAALMVAAAAHQAFAHFLAPSVAPAALALCSIRRPQLTAPLSSPRGAPLGLGQILGQRQVAAALLGAGVVVAGIMGHTAGLDWVPAASRQGGYRDLGGYYWGAVRAVVLPWTRPAWDAYFDERVPGDAAAAAWIRTHGLAGHSTVVWSNDAWPYLLSDVPLVLPTAPIYNNINLFRKQGATAAQVARLDPEMIVTSDETLAAYPAVRPVLQNYRPVCQSGRITLWLRDSVKVR